MIQRIQSLYLLLLAIFSVIGLFFLPFFDLSLIIFSTAVLLKVYIAQSITLSIFSLLLFKKRKVQLWINRIQMGIQLLFIIFLIYAWASVRITDMHLIWLALPLQAIVFLFLANKGISKDEDLIRSVDRLR